MTGGIAETHDRSMSSDVELPEENRPEHRIASAIRAWIRDRDPAARELLADYGVRYARSFLHRRCSLRRFGFSDAFAEVANDVAGTEVAELLRSEEAATGPRGAAGAPPALCRRIGPAIASPPSVHAASAVDPARAVNDADDLTLFLGYRKLLRLRADQGLHRRWAEEHPEEARLLRRIKAACRRLPALERRRDLRGTFLTTRASDRSRRALRGDEIRACLDGLRAGPRAVLSRLLPLLVATEEHGGYCYQMDLVREIREDHLRRFTVWARGDALDSSANPLGPGGIPIDLAVVKIRRGLDALAETILSRDRQQATAETRCVWREVAVEMILRRYGLATDGRDPRASSQRRILAARLGLNPESEELRYHDGQTTYLVRRLRARWAR